MNYYVGRMLEHTVYRAMSGETILAYLRNNRLKQRAVVLRYHELAEDTEEAEAWTIVKKSDFLRQMEYVSSHFTVLSLREAFDTIHGPQDNREIDKPIVVVTFDDGYERNRTLLLPLIQSLNIPATIFIATKSVQEERLYWDARVINALQGSRPIRIDLEDLSLGVYTIKSANGPDKWMEIDTLISRLKDLDVIQRKIAVERIMEQTGGGGHAGMKAFTPLSLPGLLQLAACPLISLEAHSHCHNILTQIANPEIRDSVRTSKQLLEAWTKKPVTFFAYPNGNYDQRVMNIVKELGFEGSVITKARPWGREEEPFAIPRVGIGRYDSFETFKLKVSSGGIRSLLTAGRN